MSAKCLNTSDVNKLQTQKLNTVHTISFHKLSNFFVLKKTYCNIILCWP